MDIVRGEATFLGPITQSGGLRNDQNDREFSFVPDHHDVGNERTCFDAILDELRRDILPTGGDDDVFLAIGDAKVAVGNLTNVAGVKPSILFEYLTGL